MLPTINAAVLRERRGLVEEGTMIGLDEKRKLMKMYNQDWLLHKQDLIQLSKCAINNVKSAYFSSVDGRIKVFLFTWTSKLSLSRLLLKEQFCRATLRFAFCASSTLQRKMGSNDTNHMVFTRRLSALQKTSCRVASYLF